MKKFKKRIFQLLIDIIVNIVLIILNLIVCITYTADKNYSMAVVPFFFAIWFLAVIVMKIIIFYIDQYVHELEEKLDNLSSKNIP